ncbi:FAD-binding protein [Clostridium chauvoei]|nr:FAD-binding protein [Clostridium chauvoei]
MIQYLAYKNGCELINLDLIQFIPAYINPLYKTVFNERVFNYITLKDRDGNNILKDLSSIDELLKERSTYGPFTSRLKSNIIDKKIFQYYKKDNDSVYFEYPKNIENIDDTLIYNYFKWLKESNKNIKDKIHIAPFAHACNGGLKIDENASTTVKGIFACGEATGGVHGADRIGGLSTSNALVFGAIAGKNASEYCKSHEFEDFNIDINSNIEINEKDIIEFNNILFNIRKTLYLEASILKDDKSIQKAKKTITSLMREFKNLKLSLTNNSILESYLNFSLLYLNSIK